MKIKAVSISNIPAIQQFEVSNLSDFVVVAGVNGAGKTKLVQAIIQSFMTGGNQQTFLILECTSKEEKEHFGENQFNLPNSNYHSKFKAFLQKNNKRKNIRGSILNFESNRQFVQVKPLAFSFEFIDPDNEEVPWNLPSQSLCGRWQDTQHSILKKILAKRNQLGSSALKLRRDGKSEMKLGFSDPIEPFKKAFASLLSPKTLIDPDLQNQNLMYEENGQKRSINTLSSGENEVLRIAFDLILRQPSDCIIFIDEPEMHLHPELLNRLLITLRGIGERNQFILVTHSPEVISSSLDDTVIFLSKAKPQSKNQATILSTESAETRVLQELGQSIGIVALGKKIVLIEGDGNSLDKKTYSMITKGLFPELVLVPSGGKRNVSNFGEISENVLANSLWGIDFFMLADRDSGLEVSEPQSKLRTLPRYHLENYFLEADLICAAIIDLFDTGDWQLDPSIIEEKLKEKANAQLSYSVAIHASNRIRCEAGNVTVLPKGSHSMQFGELLEAALKQAEEETRRIGTSLSAERITEVFREEHARISSLLESDDWKHEIPAKQIFASLCNEIDIRQGQLRNLYIKKAIELGHSAFDDIKEIFSDFSTYNDR